ncbi:hypothetical protein GGI42DRAFT_328690 [Trichoderma sp. SZMC 28013]
MYWYGAVGDAIKSSLAGWLAGWLVHGMDGTVTLAVLYCSSMQASPGYCLVCSVAIQRQAVPQEPHGRAQARTGTRTLAHVDGLDELVSMCEGVSCTRRRTACLVIPHKPQPCQRQADVLGLAGDFTFSICTSTDRGYTP